VPSKAPRLDGVDDFVETPQGPGLHLGRELTFTGWFLVNDLANESEGWQNMFWKGDAPDRAPYNAREYSLRLYGAGLTLLEATPEGRKEIGNLSLPTDTDIIRAGEWHHFAAIVSASRNQMQLYVNGLLQVSRPFDPKGMAETSAPLQFGRVARRDYFGGRLDEVQLWNRALSRAEIDNSMSSIGGLGPGLVAYYDFDELDASGMVPDRSGNGHRLYLRNGARIANPEIRVPPIADAGPNGSGGIFVRALSLNGGGDYLEVPVAVSLHLQGEMTIEAWIRPENIVAASQGIFIEGIGTGPILGSDWQNRLQLNRSGALHLISTPKDHTAQLKLQTCDNSIRTGQWQHFAVVVSGRDDLMAIFIDGV